MSLCSFVYLVDITMRNMGAAIDVHLSRLGTSLEVFDAARWVSRTATGLSASGLDLDVVSTQPFPPPQATACEA